MADYTQNVTYLLTEEFYVPQIEPDYSMSPVKPALSWHSVLYLPWIERNKHQIIIAVSNAFSSILAQNSPPPPNTHEMLISDSV